MSTRELIGYLKLQEHKLPRHSRNSIKSAFHCGIKSFDKWSSKLDQCKNESFRGGTNFRRRVTDSIGRGISNFTRKIAVKIFKQSVGVFVRKKVLFRRRLLFQRTITMLSLQNIRTYTKKTIHWKEINKKNFLKKKENVCSLFYVWFNRWTY